MTFYVVEIDNDIGTTTVKDEGGGVVSLDINLRSVSDSVEITTKAEADKLLKGYFNFTEVTQSCSPSPTWTQFYSFTPASGVFFQELLVAPDNDHNIKIEIDGTSLFEFTIKSYKDFGMNKDSLMMSDVLIYKDDTKIMRVNLNNSHGENLKIYQQRRDTNTGNLTIKGLCVFYKEDA